MIIEIHLDLPDRSCVFYVTHPENWSTGNVREFFSQWTLLTYERVNSTTHAVAVSLKKDTLETSKSHLHPSLISHCFSVLTKMRANDKNLTITPYLEYHQLDSSQVKIKEPNHLFDVDPNNRRSNKRAYVDRDNTVSPLSLNERHDKPVDFQPAEVPSESNASSTKPSDELIVVQKPSTPTIEQLIEQKEKVKGMKRQKLFEYDDEW